jgi:diguanylate cyclase (GGDEF)-like protein/PAS domain S-box-containing protein
MTFFNNAFEQDKVPMGQLIFNADGLSIEVNDRYSVMSGFSKHNLLNKPSDIFDVFSTNEIQLDKTSDFSGYYNSTLTNHSGKSFPVQVFYFCQGPIHERLTILFIKDLSSNEIAKSKVSIIKKVFNQSKEAIAITDNKGYIQSINEKFCHITGYSSEDVIGKTPAILNSGKHNEEFYKEFWFKLRKEGSWHGEIWNKRKNGDIYPEWLNISSVRNDEGKTTNYIAQFIDITKRKKLEEEQLFQAYHDPLTNLPNRNLLFEKLKNLCNRDAKCSTHFAVLFCDLDRFKLINDSLGHQVGDELLKSVSYRLLNKLRENDIIARSGGDEFIIIIEGEKALKNVDKICLQILALFTDPFETKYGEFRASLSIGVSKFAIDSLDVRELISYADTAMLKIKEKGGNSYEVFDNKERLMIKQRLELEQEISQAIKKKHFEVWYQPQINACTGEVYGVECLLRWSHPKQGLISPNLFIPLAESNGTIKDLGYYVLKTACKQLRQWRINNIFTGVIAINISIRQFDRNDLLSQVQELLTNEMIPGEALELEVTESLFLEDNSHLVPTLIAIRELGVKIAIDDFGTGFSSLQRLKTLPIDNVKIDKCFIDNIVKSEEDISIVQAVTSLSKTFKFDLIAEGIEEKEQAEKLNSLGCFNHQGFLYSKPLRADDFEVWLKEFKSSNEQKTTTAQNIGCK